MSLQYDIRKISTAETLDLRQRILKPFLTKEECVVPGDDLITTVHFGLSHAGKLVSIATFIQESHPNLNSGFPYRLRGMATDSKYQGQGLGQILLRYGVEYLKQKRCDLVWFNARIKAFRFYEKQGYQYYGPLFEMKDIGPHKVMYKPLIPR